MGLGLRSLLGVRVAEDELPEAPLDVLSVLVLGGEGHELLEHGSRAGPAHADLRLRLRRGARPRAGGARLDGDVGTHVRDLVCSLAVLGGPEDDDQDNNEGQDAGSCAACDEELALLRRFLGFALGGALGGAAGAGADPPGVRQRLADEGSLDVGPELAGRAVAVVGVLGHAVLDDGEDGFGELVCVLSGVGYGVVEVAGHDDGGRGAVVGDVAGDHVVEGAAEGVDVGALVDLLLASDLLG